MDIKKFKQSLAGLMSQLYILDVNGVPTNRHMVALPEAPASLTETDLPTWIIFVGAAQYPNPPDQTMERLTSEVRDFTLSLYTTITQSGIDGEAERRVEPYLDYARNHIQRHIQLWDGEPDHRVPGVQRTYLIRDEGVATLRYGILDKPLYLGLRFTLRVEAKNYVDFAMNQ